jgi:hypothetical protein
MAYREFYKQQPTIINDYSPIERGLQSVGAIFSSIAAAKKKEALTIDQYKVDLNQGKFENDERLKNELVRSLTEEGKQLLRSGKGFTSDYNKKLAEATTLDNSSTIQYDRWQKDLASINKRSTDDKYYDPRYDEELLREATHGKDNEVNFFDRGDRLAQAEQRLGKNPLAFRINDYTADFVKGYGTKEKTNASGNPNATNTIYNSSPFWDTKTGKPGVTDRHAVEYLKSRPDGSVQAFLETEVSNELEQEMENMKRSGDQRTSWMNGLSDLEIKNELIRDPSKNIINKNDFGIRVRDKAKQRLEDAADIKSKVDVEYKKDTSKTGGLYNNDAIAHSDTFYNEQVGTQGVPDRVAGANRMNQNAAPGGILMISKGLTTGKPIAFESGSKNIFNVNSGTVQQARGSATFNLTGYQVQAYDKNGKPYFIEAADPEDLKNKIRNMSYSEFQNLDPELKIALKGYSLNRGKMIGDIRSSTYNLNTELAKARSEGNAERIAQIEAQMYEMESFKSQLNGDADDFTDDDIMNAAARNGITAVRTDQLVKADKADLDKINTITEGLNLNNREKWSPEMREVADLYNQKAQEAAAMGYKETRNKKGVSKPIKGIGVPIESDGTDLDTWKPGGEYKIPNGNIYFYDKAKGEWSKK